LQDVKIEDMELLKDKLIDAACELFTATGYNGVTVRMIAARAGVDSREFYYVFSSKEELLENVVGHITDDEVTQIKAICCAQDDPLGRLMDVVRFMLGCRSSRGLLVNLVEKRSVIINNMFRENIMDKATPLLAEVIESGVKAGTLRACEPRHTAMFIINSVSYVFYYMITGDDREDTLAMATALIQMLCATLGIKPDAAAEDAASLQKFLIASA